MQINLAWKDKKGKLWILVLNHGEKRGNLICVDGNKVEFGGVNAPENWIYKEAIITNSGDIVKIIDKKETKHTY